MEDVTATLRLVQIVLAILVGLVTLVVVPIAMQIRKNARLDVWRRTVDRQIGTGDDGKPGVLQKRIEDVGVLLGEVRTEGAEAHKAHEEILAVSKQNTRDMEFIRGSLGKLDTKVDQVGNDLHTLSARVAFFEGANAVAKMFSDKGG